MIVRDVSDADRDRWLDMRVALWPEGSRDEHAAEIDELFHGTASEPQAVLVAEAAGLHRIRLRHGGG